MNNMENKKVEKRKLPIKNITEKYKEVVIKDRKGGIMEPTQRSIDIVKKYSKGMHPERLKEAALVLDRLFEGNERYVSGELKRSGEPANREELLKGQSPKITVITCSDSRVKVDRAFDAVEGEIFDIQTAGEVLDESGMGSVQYAVEHLKSPLIIVLGHEQCGAVTAAYNQAKEKGALGKLVANIAERISGAKDLDEAIHKNTLAVVEQLKNDEVIKEAYEKGEVAIIPMHFHLGSKVEAL